MVLQCSTIGPDVKMYLTFQLLYPTRMDRDSPFQSISHITFQWIWRLRLSELYNSAAEMWLWETICFENVFGMSCTLDIKSMLAAHTFWRSKRSGNMQMAACHRPTCLNHQPWGRFGEWALRGTKFGSKDLCPGGVEFRKATENCHGLIGRS